MKRTRSSRALAGALLLAVCGPIAAVSIGVASPNSEVPQAAKGVRFGHPGHACRVGSCPPKGRIPQPRTAETEPDRDLF